MDEQKRIAEFVRLVGEPPIFRRRVIEAFLPTFCCLGNYYTKPRPDMVHVGTRLLIGIDADRMVRDFPMFGYCISCGTHFRPIGTPSVVRSRSP